MAQRSFRYYVTVECETAEEADTVMAERICFEEDYGFDYTIDYDFHSVTDYEEEG